MTNDDVRRWLNALPFETFNLRLVDGRVFRVEHPDFVWFPPKSQRVRHVFSPEGVEVVINTTIVTSLDRHIRPRIDGVNRSS